MLGLLWEDSRIPHWEADMGDGEGLETVGVGEDGVLQERWLGKVSEEVIQT